MLLFQIIERLAQLYEIGHLELEFFRTTGLRTKSLAPERSISIRRGTSSNPERARIGTFSGTSGQRPYLANDVQTRCERPFEHVVDQYKVERSLRNED